MQKTAILAAILGITAGVAATVTFTRIEENRKHLKTQLQDWRKLNLVLEQVDGNYVDTIDRKKVTEAAIQAVLSSLDPHSVYLPPQELKSSEEDLTGGFDGIGIQFNVPADTAVVIEVIPGGPSEKIGLRPGDRILKVDDKIIAGVKFPQDSMVRRMRGKAGTQVLITVKRDKEVIPFEITRGKIPTHSVDAAFMVNDTTAYLRLSKFSRSTAKEFLEASGEMLGEGMKEMILDLRDNSGGYMDQALILSNLFLPKGANIVYTEGLHRGKESYDADGKGPLQEIGLKVLINDGTASSSEIFAGAIQDNSRGRIFGRRSFGKGLVQEPVYFSDGSGIRLTVARFHTPSGRCIQKEYADDYSYDIIKRYNSGEMFNADSMKVEKGGIIPDVFIPIDTTSVGKFYQACTRKATTMRFASSWFDSNKAVLGQIDTYAGLLSYLDNAGLEQAFLKFAKEKDCLVPSASEWKRDGKYLMTQVRALTGRYSKLSDNAYFHLYLGIDDIYKTALETN